MANAIVKEAKDKMEKSLDSFVHEIANIRTGRASAGMLDIVDVDVYGTKMKINQLGTVSVPEPRLLVITPWDKSQINTIEKAISTSPLELNPGNDGQVIRVPVPPLTEERRKELVKLVSRLAEDARVAIRNIRRHAMDEIKQKQKDGDLPEDDAHRLSEEIQKTTDEYVKRIDESLASKEEEIMEV